MAECGLNEPAGEYEALILQLPGILNAKVVISGETLTEIHILSDDSRAPKRVARDVQSAISARFGTEIDYKIISVAQIPAQSKTALHGRLVFDEIVCVKNKEHSSVTVKLSDGEQSFSGTSSGLNAGQEISRAVCQATLEAVNGSLESRLTFSAADVKMYELAGESALSVCVLAKSEHKTERLIGSAFLGDDAETAVVKATLDALNRRIAVV